MQRGAEAEAHTLVLYRECTRARSDLEKALDISTRKLQFMA